MFSELDLILSFGFRTKDPVLIDVGAHWGGVSERFLRRGWRVVAFEPEDRNRQILLDRLGHFPLLTCIDKAVALKTENGVPFYVSTVHHGIHSLGSFHPSHSCEYEVNTVRLDDCLANESIHEVTFLKIDIEGADFLALQSFDFERWRPELVMAEFMDHRSSRLFSYTHHDMAAFMAGKGYATFVSEWSEIDEYEKPGVPASHKWIRCVPYTPASNPAWGNLIFVPDDQSLRFGANIRRYRLWGPAAQALKRTVKALPGAERAFQAIGHVLSSGVRSITVSS